jgi:hypothetical protein
MAGMTSDASSMKPTRTYEYTLMHVKSHLGEDAK